MSDRLWHVLKGKTPCNFFFIILLGKNLLRWKKWLLWMMKTGGVYIYDGGFFEKKHNGLKPLFIFARKKAPSYMFDWDLNTPLKTLLRMKNYPLLLILYVPLYGTKYSRMDQVKFYGRQPLKSLKGYGLLKYIEFICLWNFLLSSTFYDTKFTWSLLLLTCRRRRFIDFMAMIWCKFVITFS